MAALVFTLQHSRRAVSRQQTANQRATLMTICRSCGGLPRGESTLQGSGV